MGADSKIEWCDHTFNPWIGCTKVSPGCANCYAEGESKRRGWAAYLRVHPVVDSLRGEPGFDALIERMKFDAPAGPPPMTPDSAAAYV